MARLRHKDNGTVIHAPDHLVDYFRSQGYGSESDKADEKKADSDKDGSADYVQIQPKRRGRPRKSED